MDKWTERWLPDKIKVDWLTFSITFITFSTIWALYAPPQPLVGLKNVTWKENNVFQDESSIQ